MAGELQEVRGASSPLSQRSLLIRLFYQTSLSKIAHIVHEQDLLENPQMNNSGDFSIF